MSDMTHTSTSARRRTHAHTHTHTRAHARTHAHTHKHLHKQQKQPPLLPPIHTHHLKVFGGIPRRCLLCPFWKTPPKCNTTSHIPQSNAAKWCGVIRHSHSCDAHMGRVESHKVIVMWCICGSHKVLILWRTCGTSQIPQSKSRVTHMWIPQSNSHVTHMWDESYPTK